MKKPVTTQHFVVTVRSDGRYAPEELAAHLAGRAWNIDGVIPHGADARPVASTQPELMILADVVKAGEIVISTGEMTGTQVIQWDKTAPPMEVGDRVYLQKRVKTSDDKVEDLIAKSEGIWHEDVFHIDSANLMALLRSAQKFGGQS